MAYSWLTVRNAVGSHLVYVYYPQRNIMYYAIESQTSRELYLVLMCSG
jgi:hypothetical protein